MNCLLEGNCVKVFGKAVQALARVGAELWLDPADRGLALRSVNPAQSAYGCFLFSPQFFQRYRLTAEPHRLMCKLLTKSILPLFRCLTSLERNVEQCHISISLPSDQVIIQFVCKHGITKTHNLRFQESEVLQAVFTPHLCPNVLRAPARLLGDMVMHFPASQEEITLSVTPLRVSLRNYYEEGRDHMKVMNTEMALHPDEFDYFQIRVDSDITFCLKELRGLLSFAESHCLPVSVHSAAAGKPVCFSVENMLLEASVVLATLLDCESRGPSQPTAPAAPATPRCADAAAVPVSGCEADTSKPHGVPVLRELVASSQGSQPTNPPGASPTTTTPASSMICSLLFRALSSEQDGAGWADSLPVLARYSDEEESMDEDSTGSPKL